MKTKILVTGGNGFLGKHVVKQLALNKENDLTILADKKNNFGSGIKFLRIDLRDEKKVLKKVKDFDVVFHLAGNTITNKTNVPELHNEVNAFGTLNLLRACAKSKIKHFIFVSTCEVYGSNLKGKVLESRKPKPINDYGKSKFIAEGYCKKFSKFFKVTIIRPSYIYGIGQPKERFFSKLIVSAIKDKKIKFSPDAGGYDFVYIKDATKGIIKLAQRKNKKKLEIFNLSSGKYSSMKQIFNLLMEITGKSYIENFLLHQKNRNQKMFFLSIKKAQKKGYVPKYSLKEGLRDYINYF